MGKKHRFTPLQKELLEAVDKAGRIPHDRVWYVTSTPTVTSLISRGFLKWDRMADGSLFLVRDKYGDLPKYSEDEAIESIKRAMIGASA